MMLFDKVQCIGVMDDALQAPVHLDCGSAVLRIRQCLYRARQYCQARGNYRYDGLKFHVRGPTLVIGNRADPGLNQLHEALNLHREPRGAVTQHEASVSGRRGHAEDCAHESGQSNFLHHQEENEGLRITIPEEDNR